MKTMNIAKNVAKLFTLFALGVTLVPFASFADGKSGRQLKEKVRAEEQYSDTWLEAKLDTTIALNRHLSLFDIDTDVRSQVAYLSGYVGTDIEKDLAGEVAKSIEGIKNVKNDIMVDVSKAAAVKTSKSSSSSRSFGQTIDDITITASIKSSLIINDNIEGTEVNVDTMNGKVTLKGEVRSSTEKELAEKIAENTGGVKNVVNNLQIKSDDKTS